MTDLQAFSVNRDGWEVIRQPLYDSYLYGTGGTTQASFFSTPIGQGTGIGGAAKTLTDTNMQLAGQLPANQAFLLEAVSLLFEPSTPTVAASMPAAFGAQAVATGVNDSYIFRRNGNLTLQIGSKVYLQDGPLMKFPSPGDFMVSGAAADVSSAAANLQTRIVYGKAVGPIYQIKPASMLIPANQGFSLTLNWPEGVQAITSAARVIATLHGYLYRRSQ
jgi:hypothetical protein